MFTATVSGSQNWSQMWCIKEPRPATWTVDRVDRIMVCGPSQVDPREGDDEGRDFTGIKSLGQNMKFSFFLG